MEKTSKKQWLTSWLYLTLVKTVPSDLPYWCQAISCGWDENSSEQWMRARFVNSSWRRNWVNVILITYEDLSSVLNVSFFFFFPPTSLEEFYFHKGWLLKSCMLLGMKYSIIAWSHVYSNSCSFLLICIHLLFFLLEISLLVFQN